MAKPLVSDQLWEIIEPLLPLEPPKRKGGRPRVPVRAALTGTIFVLKSGSPWEMLPLEMGCGSGMTCWWRLRDWQTAGVWERLCPHLCALPLMMVLRGTLSSYELAGVSTAARSVRDFGTELFPRQSGAIAKLPGERQDAI